MSSKWEITGIVKHAPRGIGLRLEDRELVRGKEYVNTHEVICFDREKLSGLDAGDRVTVKGRLGRKKTNFTDVGKDGKEYPVYTAQLIVTSIVPADGSRTSAEPQTPRRTQASAPQTQQEMDREDDELGF